MGQELERATFTDTDFARFVERVKAETDLVEQWEAEGRISEGPSMAGFELEAWLVDKDMQPVPRNEDFIEALGSDEVVPEIAKFNIEFNMDPAVLKEKALSTLHARLEAQWKRAAWTASDMGLQVAMIGILPTIRGELLNLANMSTSKRYKAINEQVFRLRKGRPIRLDIKGQDHLQSVHQDVMLEAGATSFQMHLKIPATRSADYFNASKLASAPLVALSANSPFLFGHDLWAETRIPLFEQAVSVGDWDYAERVTFGVRFIEKGLSEVFLANRQRYPVLLPQTSDTPVETLAHLKLHNGTIWRWNRPIVGWDADGTPHYRIEQRVAPAGPTITDQIANAAFYYGLVHALANADIPPDRQCQFFTCRDNFYDAARLGLDARVRWEHEDDRPIDRLILDVFLPMAEQGLDALGIDRIDRDTYLGIIAARAKTGQNGARWQRAFVARNGKDMATLLRAYMERSHEGGPVAHWG